MNQLEMREILSELKSELMNNHQLGTHQRQTMQAFVEEIERRVTDPEVEMSGDEFLINRFKGQTQDFEQNHPRLTAIIGRLSDQLARIGL